MTAVLIGVFLALLAALALGIAMGYFLAQTRDHGLNEQLDRANADLEAHAVELADANEEITCLLEELHRARRGDEGRGLRSG